MRAIHSLRNSRLRVLRWMYAWARARSTYWFATLNQRLFFPQYPLASLRILWWRRLAVTPRFTRAIGGLLLSRARPPPRPERVASLAVGDQALHPGPVRRIDLTEFAQGPLAARPLPHHEVAAELPSAEAASPARDPDALRRPLMRLQFRHGPVSSGASFFFGASTMTMLRPSMDGGRSTTATSASCWAIRSRICSPTCGWAISRPRNHMDTRTLSPSLRKPLTAFVFTCRSCSLIFGLRRIPLSSEVLDFRWAWRSRLACSYLYFPKSMIRHTGGLAVGATSTRSSPASWARASASRMGTIPSCSPFRPISRTSRARMRSFILVSRSIDPQPPLGRNSNGMAAPPPPRTSPATDLIGGSPAGDRDVSDATRRAIR